MLGLLPLNWCTGQVPVPCATPSGFTALFDGQTLAGWHVAPRLGVPKTAREALAPAKESAKGPIGLAQAHAKGRWEVRDGVTKVEFASTGEDFRKAWHLHDWNHFRIRVVGASPRITVWINETKICECDTAALQHPDYQPSEVQKLLGTEGRIAFEVHDGPPWGWGIGKVSRWKNLFIKSL